MFIKVSVIHKLANDDNLLYDVLSYLSQHFHAFFLSVQQYFSMNLQVGLVVDFEVPMDLSE